MIIILFFHTVRMSPPANCVEGTQFRRSDNVPITIIHCCKSCQLLEDLHRVRNWLQIGSQIDFRSLRSQHLTVGRRSRRSLATAVLCSLLTELERSSRGLRHDTTCSGSTDTAGLFFFCLFHTSLSWFRNRNSRRPVKCPHKFCLAAWQSDLSQSHTQSVVCLVSYRSPFNLFNLMVRGEDRELFRGLERL